MEVPVPGEPGKPGGPPEGSPPAEPHVWVALFSYPTNGTFADYSEEIDKVAPSIPNGESFAFLPTPKRTIDGQKIPGTVSASGFRIWWTDQNITLSQLLTNDETITPEQKEIAVRSLIVDKLVHIGRIKRCIVHSYSMMTDPKSRVNIMKISLIPPDGVIESDFTNKIEEISVAIGAKWVRARKDIDRNGRSVINLYVGDGAPNDSGIIYPKNAASRYKKLLYDIDWAYTYHLNGIYSTQVGTPKIMLTRSITDNSEETVFDLPKGISLKDIFKKEDSIKTSSGNSYIEIHEGIPGKKNYTPREKREIDRFIKRNGSTSQFTMVSAVEHPLEKVFYFSEYEDKIITGREPGVAKISWSPGVLSSGNLAFHTFESDMPHLTIAGSSGSGKSVLIYSLLCQFMANNSPLDLQCWIIDPKVGYQKFQFLDSITRYVDEFTPAEGNFFISVRNMLRDAVYEMKARNRLFRFAKTEEPIDKLALAREVGFKQGPLPDGSPNPLIKPYIIIIMDEVAMLFAGAPDKETKEIQAEILYYSSKLARESRSAGIHCVFATQYPTTASLPSLIKQQSGRIGLMTQDGLASKVIIDQTGLEDLWIKGTGKIKQDKDYFDFRGFLLEDHKKNEHSMMKIMNETPNRAYDPIIDGDYNPFEEDEDSGSDSGLVLPGDPGYADIPLPDESLFSSWSQSGVGRVLEEALNSSKANRLINSLENISEEEFDKMTLEEFKRAMIS